MDIERTIELQSLLLRLVGDSAWEFITFAGDGIFVFLVYIIACALGRYRFAFIVGSLSCIAGILVNLLKQFIQEPRPFIVSSDISAHSLSAGFGMPSGHTASIVVLSLVVCLIGQKSFLWFAASVVAILVGLSRVALGVHSLEQVMYGAALGGIVIFGYLLLRQPASRMISVLNSACLYGATFGLMLCIIAIQLYVSKVVGGEFVIPELWVDKYKETITVVGQSNRDEMVTAQKLGLFRSHHILLSALLAGIYVSSIYNAKKDHLWASTHFNLQSATIVCLALIVALALIAVLKNHVLLMTPVFLALPVVISTVAPRVVQSTKKSNS